VKMGRGLNGIEDNTHLPYWRRNLVLRVLVEKLGLRREREEFDWGRDDCGGHSGRWVAEAVGEVFTTTSNTEKTLTLFRRR